MTFNPTSLPMILVSLIHDAVNIFVVHAAKLISLPQAHASPWLVLWEWILLTPDKISIILGLLSILSRNSTPLLKIHSFRIILNTSSKRTWWNPWMHYQPQLFLINFASNTWTLLKMHVLVLPTRPLRLLLIGYLAHPEQSLLIISMYIILPRLNPPKQSPLLNTYVWKRYGKMAKLAGLMPLLCVNNTPGPLWTTHFNTTSRIIHVFNGRKHMRVPSPLLINTPVLWQPKVNKALSTNLVSKSLKTHPMPSISMSSMGTTSGRKPWIRKFNP